MLRQTHLSVKPDERFNAPSPQQQRQPHTTVQPVGVPNHRIARHWYTENENAAGADQRPHFIHGAHVAVGVDGISVSAETVMLEVRYGDDKVE
jgi:hypothetical protein